MILRSSSMHHPNGEESSNFYDDNDDNDHKGRNTNPNHHHHHMQQQHHHHHPRRTEFDILHDEPTMSEQQRNIRKQRMQQERDIQDTFVSYGNELWDLQRDICHVCKQLIETLARGDDTKIIRSKLRELESRDANVVYGLELDKMDQAVQDGRWEDGEKHKYMATRARSHLVQFNLEGLWVGKYGDHGFEMINVTYVGDTLVARKVTGDKNVPMGEITFQVDLSPRTRYSSTSTTSSNTTPHSSSETILPNIILSDDAAKRWGNRELQRFHGLGQVAEVGFQNSQWLEGQMVLINEEYFSFAWLPLAQQIFFGRPSPELALAMMKEQRSSSSSLSLPWLNSKSDPSMEASVEYIRTCYESTVYSMEDGSVEDLSDSCIFWDDDHGVMCFE